MSLVVQMADDLKALDKQHVEQRAEDIATTVSRAKAAPAEALPLFAAANQLHAKSKSRRRLSGAIIVALLALAMLTALYFFNGGEALKSINPFTPLNSDVSLQVPQVLSEPKNSLVVEKPVAVK